MFLLRLLSDVCCSATIPYIWATDWMIVGNHLKKSLVVTSIEFIAVSPGGCRAKDTGNSGLVAVSSSGGVNGVWLGNHIWAIRWTECSFEQINRSIEQIARSIEQITWSILTII